MSIRHLLTSGLLALVLAAPTPVFADPSEQLAAIARQAAQDSNPTLAFLQGVARMGDFDMNQTQLRQALQRAGADSGALGQMLGPVQRISLQGDRLRIQRDDQLRMPLGDSGAIQMDERVEIRLRQTNDGMRLDDVRGIKVAEGMNSSFYGLNKVDFKNQSGQPVAVINAGPWPFSKSTTVALTPPVAEEAPVALVPTEPEPEVTAVASADPVEPVTTPDVPRNQTQGMTGRLNDDVTAPMTGQTDQANQTNQADTLARSDDPIQPLEPQSEAQGERQGTLAQGEQQGTLDGQPIDPITGKPVLEPVDPADPAEFVTPPEAERLVMEEKADELATDTEEAVRELEELKRLHAEDPAAAEALINTRIEELNADSDRLEAENRELVANNPELREYLGANGGYDDPAFEDLDSVANPTFSEPSFEGFDDGSGAPFADGNRSPVRPYSGSGSDYEPYDPNSMYMPADTRGGSGGGSGGEGEIGFFGKLFLMLMDKAPEAIQLYGQAQIRNKFRAAENMLYNSDPRYYPYYGSVVDNRLAPVANNTLAGGGGGTYAGFSNGSGVNSGGGFNTTNPNVGGSSSPLRPVNSNGAGGVTNTGVNSGGGTYTPGTTGTRPRFNYRNTLGTGSAGYTNTGSTRPSGSGNTTPTTVPSSSGGSQPLSSGFGHPSTTTPTTPPPLVTLPGNTGSGTPLGPRRP
jgi:hypothetical protein